MANNKEKNIIIDKLLLIGTSLLLLSVSAAFYLPLKFVFKLPEIKINFLFTAITIFGFSIYGIYLYFKEERIREKKYIYILFVFGLYLIYMGLIIVVDKLQIVSMEDLIGRVYKIWAVQMFYIFILRFLLEYVQDKFGE